MTIPQAFELAIEHHKAGRLAEAEAIYRQILGQDPNHADALQHLGIIAGQMGRHDIALELIQQAIDRMPDAPAFHSNLGHACRNLGRLNEAVAAFRRALELKPGDADTHYHLANVLKEQGLLDETVAAYRNAIQLRPDYAAAHSNLGAALNLQGHTDEALAECRRALDIRPDYPNAKFNHSFLLLLRGDFEHGWPSYEARWDSDDCTSPKRNFSQPMWDGGPLNSERVLIHAEQGLGDSIQFIRYASLVAERGGKVVVECQPPLVELLRSAEGVAEVVPAGEPLPSFDVHVPMLSLPLAFKTTLETIPREIPYLAASPARCDSWRKRIGANQSRLKVGLAWTGSAKHLQNRRRSIRLAQLLPLLRVKGVDFFSLQRGFGSEQIQQLSEAAGIIDHTCDLDDFAGTAALLMQLDLVISVDTAIVHLAGALGRPVWTLLAFAPDWRWMLGRTDSPWYPTMRLFRQPATTEWEGVVHAVCEQLRLLAASRT